MNRVAQLETVFESAMRDPHLSMTGIAQALHRGVPEVKQVAKVSDKDESQITFSVLFHDRERLSITIHRMGNDEVAPEDETVVEREVLPELWALDVTMKDGKIELNNPTSIH